MVNRIQIVAHLLQRMQSGKKNKIIVHEWEQILCANFRTVEIGQESKEVDTI